MLHPSYHTLYATHMQYQNSGALANPRKRMNSFLLLLLLRTTDTWKSSVAYSNRLRDGFALWEGAVACSKALTWHLLGKKTTTCATVPKAALNARKGTYCLTHRPCHKTWKKTAAGQCLPSYPFKQQANFHKTLSLG